MKKTLIVFALLSLASFSGFSQQLSENFEASSSIPEGWISRSAVENYKNEVAPYADNKMLSGFTGFSDGGQYAAHIKSGKAIKPTGSDTAVSPDSWLISPKFTVSSGDVLNFMMAYNCSFNAAKKNDSEKVKFSILVSTTSTDEADFTNEIATLLPSDKVNWSSYSYDLSQFAGKEIYVAFRHYGENTASFPFTTNDIFLDNITVSANKTSDLSVAEIINPLSGCSTEQTVSASISNIGFEATSYKVCYQVGNGEVVTENGTAPIANGESVVHTFATKAVLPFGGSYDVKVWVESDNDNNAGNNELTKTVTIGDEIPYPFAMTDANIETSFHSTRTVGTYGWSFSDDERAWGFIYRSGVTSYLQSNCISLPKGTVQLTFDYKTLIDAPVQFHLIYDGNDDIAQTSKTLTNSTDYTQAIVQLNVPQEGVYHIAMIPQSDYAGQLFVKNVNISDPYDDVAVSSIDSPKLNATIAKSGIEVAATVSNVGTFEINNVPVSLELDGKEISTQTIAHLDAGESKQIVFSERIDLSSTGNHKIVVKSMLESDKNSVNDQKEFAINSYEPYSFPFDYGFEDDAKNQNWITYNPDNDLLAWEIMQVINGTVNYAKDGKNAAYISSASGIQHNDYLISPAIEVPAGKARISFYYTSRMKSSSSSDKCNIKVYLSKTDDPESAIKGEPLTVATLTDDNVLNYTQGYALANVEEAGRYYLVFYNDGTGHDIIFDDVRFDTEEDLSMLSLANTAASGFNLTDNTVSISFANHGVTTRTKIPLTLSVNGKDIASETYSGAVAPGETAQYTFAAKCDFSKAGEYVVKATINDPDDADSYNNSWYSPIIEHYAAATIPYTNDLETTDDAKGWSVGSGWVIGTNLSSARSAYSGKGGLYHAGSAMSAGDEIYSGAIDIKAGTYDAGFFYRTFLNQTNPETYGQNFEVFLTATPGSSENAISIFKAENAIVATKQYEKVSKEITVPSDGQYYIGVRCTTTAQEGCLFVDMFTISEPVTEGISGEYESDFANRESEWYHYNPSSAFRQWVATNENDATFMQTSRLITSWGQPSELPGLYVSPAFAYKQGDEINVSFDYGFSTDLPSGLEAEEAAKTKLTLFVANENMPDAFTTEVTTGSDATEGRHTATGKFTAEADGIYYFGFAAEGPAKAKKDDVTVTYNLYSFKAEAPQGGVASIEASDIFSYAANVVTFHSGYVAATLYNMQGMAVGRYTATERIDLNGMPQGIYVLQVETANGVSASKLYVE